ncbi:MAG: hypothetical protein HYX63_05055 [Gammaproteobacteria bacterium]|nr:hypothetical protein [Gammaproteobacteria bacterium]
MTTRNGLFVSLLVSVFLAACSRDNLQSGVYASLRTNECLKRGSDPNCKIEGDHGYDTYARDRAKVVEK